MADYVGDNVGAHIPPVSSSCQGEVKSVRKTFALTAALAQNDTIHLGDLPEHHVIVDCILDTDDLDTNGAPAIVLEVGFLDGNSPDTDALIAASTVGQAGGIARMNSSAATRAGAFTTDRKVGVKVATGPATGATSGTIALELQYRFAQRDESVSVVS